MAAASLFCNSCTEEYNMDGITGEGLNIETSVAAPLVKARTTFGQLFDLEGIKGNITKLDGTVIDLAKANLGEVSSMFPLPIKTDAVFGSTSVVDDIEFNDIFGSDNAVKSLDSLILVLDMETNVPFEIDFALGFTGDPFPTKFSSEIFKDQLHREAHIPACENSSSKVNVSFEFKYGSVADMLCNATGMLIMMDFQIPDIIKAVTLDKDQYVDIKLKAYIKGSINPSNF